MASQSQQGLCQAKISKQTGDLRFKKHKEIGNVEDCRHSSWPRNLNSVDARHMMLTFV